MLVSSVVVLPSLLWTIRATAAQTPLLRLDAGQRAGGGEEVIVHGPQDHFATTVGRVHGAHGVDSRVLDQAVRRVEEVRSVLDEVVGEHHVHIVAASAEQPVSLAEQPVSLAEQVLFTSLNHVLRTEQAALILCGVISHGIGGFLTIIAENCFL